MSPGAKKRLKALQAWLAIASAADKSAIRAMIAKLEQQDGPSLGAVADGRLTGPSAARGNASDHPVPAAEMHSREPAAPDNHEIPREERSGTRKVPSTGMRDGTAPATVQTSLAASVGVQPAAPPPSTQLDKGAGQAARDITDGVRPGRLASCLGERCVDTKRAASPVGDTARPWRAARLALRQAGCEVKQLDGVVYIDGVRSTDRSLYP